MRPPISIIVVLALWVLVGGLTLLGAVARGDFVLAALIGVWTVWQVLSMWRMSRWPLIATIVVAIANQAWRVLGQDGDYSQFPMLGPWAVIIPMVVVIAMVVPHWKRMNWALIGVGRAARGPVVAHG